MVVRLQAPFHIAELGPLQQPRRADCDGRQHMPNDWVRAACGTALPAAEAAEVPAPTCVPNCPRVLRVLERGRRLLREMDGAPSGAVPQHVGHLASPEDCPAAMDLCWNCRTRPAAKPSPATIHRVLEGAIRGAVLPRLQALHRSSLPPVRAAAARLADRLLAPSPGIGRTIAAIETIARPYGWSVTYCAPLFEECARNLGDRFADDACDEAQLTTALLTLQAALDSMVEPLTSLPEHAPAALVVTPADEPHQLGAKLAERALQHAGWRTSSATPASDAALAALLGAEHHDVLHLALSCAFRRDHWQAKLARLIAHARTASRNPGITVSLGGRLFNEAPAAWSTVGADTCSMSSATLAQVLAGAAHRA